MIRSHSTLRPVSVRREGWAALREAKHRPSLRIVSSDHLRHALKTPIPAEQAVGRPDVTGRGHSRNMNFSRTLADRECIVPC